MSLYFEKSLMFFFVKIAAILPLSYKTFQISLKETHSICKKKYTRYSLELRTFLINMKKI